MDSNQYEISRNYNDRIIGKLVKIYINVASSGTDLNLGSKNESFEPTYSSERYLYATVKRTLDITTESGVEIMYIVEVIPGKTKKERNEEVYKYIKICKTNLTEYDEVVVKNRTRRKPIKLDEPLDFELLNRGFREFNEEVSHLAFER